MSLAPVVIELQGVGGDRRWPCVLVARTVQPARAENATMIGQVPGSMEWAVLPGVRETQSLYVGLRRCGLSVEQAGNLTARLEGIGAVPGGWSLRDVQRLRFMRWLVSAGRLGADDRIDRRSRGGFWASGRS